MSKKKIVRKGTSFVEFDAVFPDSRACLDHLFHSRFGPEPECGRCKKSSNFSLIEGGYRYASACCFGSHLNPRTGTIFSRSNIPLIIWFRCLLYLLNASSGVTISFVRKQFGLSHKAAFRMLKLLREHLARIEGAQPLGAAGGRVFVDEIALRNVIVKGGKKGVPHRMLILTDGERFMAVPVPRGKFSKAGKYLAERLAEGCAIEIRRADTLRKLLGFRNSHRLKGRAIYLTSEPDRSQYHLLSVLVVKLKLFILKSHIWISSGNLEGYLGHFLFLYNRRHCGEEAFWEAIACHPQM